MTSFVWYTRLARLTFAATACASLLTMSASVSAAGGQKIVTLTHLTAPAGIGEYEWGLGIDRLLAKNSAWLRQRSQPTQGYIYNLRRAISSPGSWNTLVFNIDPVSPWMAAHKMPPFTNGMGHLKIMGLMNATWPIWTLVTNDKGINSVQDLAGKRVALGPKAGTATVMAEETLKAAGMLNKVKLEYISFADISAGLLDGTIDVGLVPLWYNAAANKIGATEGIVNLDSAHRGFHYVAWGKGVLRKTHDELGVPYKILTIPNGTMPMQTSALTLYANPDYVGVSSTFPEKYAYEYVKNVIQHLDTINRAGGLGVLFTKEFLPYGIKNLDPGAIKAYREAGLIK